MKSTTVWLALFVVALVTACADSAAPSGNASYDLEIAKGRATSAAIQTAARLAAEAIATADARTAIAFSRESTRAAQAAVNALLYAQATNTAQSQFAEATGTAQYMNARADETRQAMQAEQNATRVAAIINATATDDARRWQATATADRRALDAAQMQAQATATAQAIAAQIVQQQQDDARLKAWKEYTDSILKIIIGVGSIAFLAMLIIYVAKILDSMALRRRLIETREGTVILSIVEGKPTAQLVKPVPNLLESSDEVFELPSETGRVESETRFREPDEIKVRTVRGETFTMTREPDDTRRHLALRLLRDSIMHYQRKGFDPRTITRVSTWRDLEWSADSWSRALDAIRPHVVVKQGRGGGVLCGATYPNLLALYIAVGEHRATLSKNGNGHSTQNVPERIGSFRND